MFIWEFWCGFLRLEGYVVSLLIVAVVFFFSCRSRFFCILLLCSTQTEPHPAVAALGRVAKGCVCVCVCACVCAAQSRQGVFSRDRTTQKPQHSQDKARALTIRYSHHVLPCRPLTSAGHRQLPECQGTTEHTGRQDELCIPRIARELQV